MAKKKKPHKKTRRARASVGPAPATSAVAVPAPAAPLAPAAPATPNLAGPLPATASAPVVAPAVAKPARNRPIAIDRASYVAGDLRRVAVLIVICIILEAILWFLFNHTGLGNTIYSHINL